MTVAQKQHLLAYLGYHLDACDGVWGPKTQAATEAFQRDYSLTPDGIFGDATAKKILDVIASGEVPIIKQEEKKAEDQAAAEGGGAEGLKADGDPGQETQTALLAAVAAGRMYTPTKTENAETGTFWDEIRYFRRAEFRCQCGGKYCNGFPAEPVEETVRLADEIRRRAGVPLNVNSGVRCKQHNADVGGVSNSLHLTGQAIDLGPIGGDVSAAQLQEIAEQVQTEKMPGRGGLGRYDWGVHVDNGKYSRWAKG